jgi:hypothetical protein
MGSTMRVTVAVTVTASGEILKPFAIFKGAQHGQISCEFPTYNNEMIYSCQQKAWMDERVMFEWMEKVLYPHVIQAPLGVRPILLLDSYRCHVMESVLSAIESIGVQVEIIPGGCTGMCQPIDVGVGKPLKDRVRNFWEDWMLNEGLATSFTNPPERALLSNWISNSIQSIGAGIVRNSWNHHEFPYFPTDETNSSN